MSETSLVLTSSYLVGAIGVAWTSTFLELWIAAIAAPFVYVYVTYTYAMIATSAHEKLVATTTNTTNP